MAFVDIEPFDEVTFQLYGAGMATISNILAGTDKYRAHHFMKPRRRRFESPQEKAERLLKQAKEAIPPNG